MLRRCRVAACLPTGAAAAFSSGSASPTGSYTKSDTPFRSNRARVELHNTAMPHRMMTVADLPGAIGSFSTHRQAVGVVSCVEEAGEGASDTRRAREVTVFDFAFTCGEDVGVVEGFATKGLAATRKRVCTFTLPFPPHGRRAVMHTLTQHSAHIAYHNLPKLGGAHAAAALPAPLTRTGVVYAAEETEQAAVDLHEVQDWDTAVHLDIQSVVSAGPGRWLVVAATADILASPTRPKDPEPLRANPFLGREELLVSAVRRQTLLLEDWGHEEKVAVAWWYARKYGRDNARQMFTANIINYLRTHNAEAMYNATELLALLHLVSYKVLLTPQHTSLRDFFTSHPECADPAYLSSYYSPQLLRSRASRVAFVAPDLKSLPGAPYRDQVADAVHAHGPLLTGEQPTSRTDFLRMNGDTARLTLPIAHDKYTPSLDHVYPSIDAKRKVLAYGGGRQEGFSHRMSSKRDARRVQAPGAPGSDPGPSR